nr:hypothetical protein [Tanacetum cinerariifolium]
MSDHIPFNIQAEIMKRLPVKPLNRYRGPLKIVVLWNPAVRKSVGIVIPNVMLLPRGSTGVCPNSGDPKLVKINCTCNGSLMTVDLEMEVFTLSMRVWKTVSNIPLAFKSCDLTCEGQVSIGGFIYWYASDKFKLGDGIQSNMIVSFELKSDEFGEVKESLGLLEYYEDGEVPFCGVWIMNEGVTKSFTKMFNVKILDFWRYTVLEFRNNGEAIIETAHDDSESTALEVYEPCSGRHNGIGIDGKYDSYSVEVLHGDTTLA